MHEALSIFFVHQHPLSMGEPAKPSRDSTASIDDSPSSSSAPSTPLAPPLLPPRQPLSLVQPSQKKKHKPKAFRVFRSVFRSFPIVSPAMCKTSVYPGTFSDKRSPLSSSRKVTGTLFGYRKGKVSLSIQENPRCFPSLVVELAMQTNVLQKEMGSSGMVRIALECDKRPDNNKDKVVKQLLLDEPLWNMFCNGKKTGYGVRREASEEDLQVMELLKHVSMGGGVLPGTSCCDAAAEGAADGGEMAYIRAHFERVVGSKDNETLYMLSPEGVNGPELSIFFVRI